MILKILNIASFIPINGFPPENDISLKIYADLRKSYGIESEFVKPVSHIPNWLACLKGSLRQRRRIISNKDYIDANHNIRVHFFSSSLPLANRLPFDTKFLKPLEYAFYRDSLEQKVRAFGPHIIHAHSVFPDGYYAMKLSEKFSIPYILTVRGLFDDRYKNTLVKKVLKNAFKLTTPSYSLYAALKDNYNVELLPHGIDDFWYTTEKKHYSREPIKLITVSRLLEMKHIQTILHSIAELKHEGIAVEFSIVGDGEYKKELERLVKELAITDCVIFHGWLTSEKIMEVYRNHHIFIMLSYPETFGRVYFEAAAQGLLIIGVKDTGAYGHFSNEEAFFIDIDKEQVKEILRKLTSAEFDKKAALLRKKVLEYENASIIKRYYNIINSTIG